MSVETEAPEGFDFTALRSAVRQSITRNSVNQMKKALRCCYVLPLHLTDDRFQHSGLELIRNPLVPAFALEYQVPVIHPQ